LGSYYLGGVALLDDQLVERIKAGDNAAFTILIEANQSKVYSVAYGIVRNPQDSMDIAQETFIRAWGRIGTWRGGGISFHMVVPHRL